jgi:hypothetical protein
LQSLTLNDSVSPLNSEAGSGEIILFSKDNANLNSWYSCVKNKPNLSLSESIVQVSFRNAKGDCFGIFFDPIDIRKNPVIKIRAKFQPTAGIGSVDMLAGFADDKKGKTYYPEKAKMLKVGYGFADYYFDYSNEIELSDKQVNPSKIKSILVFINILGVEDLSGVISIEGVSVSKKPA